MREWVIEYGAWNAAEEVCDARLVEKDEVVNLVM
jgi:hypothetical protein